MSCHRTRLSGAVDLQELLLISLRIFCQCSFARKHRPSHRVKHSSARSQSSSSTAFTPFFRAPSDDPFSSNTSSVALILGCSLLASSASRKHSIAPCSSPRPHSARPLLQTRDISITGHACILCLSSKASYKRAIIVGSSQCTHVGYLHQHTDAEQMTIRQKNVEGTRVLCSDTHRLSMECMRDPEGLYL